MTADGSGPQPLMDLYHGVLETVVERTGHSFDLMFAPASRCIEMFGQKNVDIMWPFIVVEDKNSIAKWGYTELPVYSMPIIVLGHRILTRVADPKVNDINALEGKLVISARGYGVPEAFDRNGRINKSQVNSNEQVVKMLRAGRVDAGIIQTGWLPTLRSQGLLEGLHYGDIIDFWGGAFTFQANEAGHALASTFTNAILRLVVSGRYNALMGDAPYVIDAYNADPVATEGRSQMPQG